MTEIIDVTLRESIYTHTHFSYEDALNYIEQANRIKFLDIIELGYVDYIGNEAPLSCYNFQYIMKASELTKKKLSVMFKLDKFLENKAIWENSIWEKIYMVRIMSSNDLSQLENAIQYFRTFHINISINHSYISAMSLQEKEILFKRLFESGADVVYIADTNGALLPVDISDIIQMIKNICDDEIKIGFHGHDYLHMAAANAYKALKEGIHYIDGTIGGLGKGAGNMPLELIPVFLEKQGEFEIQRSDLLALDKFFLFFDELTDNKYSAYDAFINLLYAYRNMKLKEFQLLSKKTEKQKLGEEMIYYENGKRTS